MNVRSDVAQAIEHAKSDLDHALSELERIPALEPATISFVAHAMSNYTNVTEAVVDLLKGALGDHPNPEVLTWLDGLRHVSSLTQQTVARLLRVYEPRETPLRFEYVKLDALMQRACDFHQAGAARKQIDILCRHPAEMPRVWADRVAVAVVADALLSNAVKFSYAGGRIDVKIQPAPGGLVCSVVDSGPGLTSLMQALIFERGPAGGRRGPPREHPTGLGLIVAKTFIDRMRGRLWSESEPGKGACFAFRLPYDPPGGRP